MAYLKKSVATSFVLLAVWCIPGCSDSPAPAPGVQSQGATSSSGAAPTSPATAELKMTVYVNFDDPDMQTFPSPDAAIIEKQVRAMNWQNAQQRPYVHLARIDASGGSYLKLKGTQGTPNTDGIFRAIGYGIGGPNWAGESPPLESVDAGLELLLLFRNDPQKLRTLIGGWKVDANQ